MTILAIVSFVHPDTTIAMQKFSQCRTALQQCSLHIHLDFVAESSCVDHEEEDQAHLDLGFLHDYWKVVRTTQDIRICLGKLAKDP